MGVLLMWVDLFMWQAVQTMGRVGGGCTDRGGCTCALVYDGSARGRKGADSTLACASCVSNRQDLKGGEQAASTKVVNNSVQLSSYLELVAGNANRGGVGVKCIILYCYQGGRWDERGREANRTDRAGCYVAQGIPLLCVFGRYWSSAVRW